MKGRCFMKTGIILFGILVAMNNVNAQNKDADARNGYRGFISQVDTLRNNYDQINSQSNKRAEEIRDLDIELRNLSGQISSFDFSKGDIADFQKLQERADAIKRQSQEFALQIRADQLGLASLEERALRLRRRNSRLTYYPFLQDDPSVSDRARSKGQELAQLGTNIHTSSETLDEFIEPHNDKIALMADIAYNRGIIQKFVNHDIKKLTQEILKASCSRATDCSNNKAINDLPRAIDQILDEMQSNQEQGGSNRSR